MAQLGEQFVSCSIMYGILGQESSSDSRGDLCSTALYDSAGHITKMDRKPRK